MIINFIDKIPIAKYITMKFIYMFISFLLITNSLFSLNSEVVIDGSSDWVEIETKKNIDKYPGKGSYSRLGLKSTGYIVDKFTDLLLHFDNSNIIDESSNYVIETNITSTGQTKKIGQGSGVFREKGEFITLHPEPGSIFSGGDVLDNFSIEFWLNPSSYSKNPVIISYQSSVRNAEENLIPQELSCSIKDRKLIWELKNIFYMNEEENDIILSGLIPIVPETWHHHLLRFNGNTGVIEYLVDGNLEAVQYASKTGIEDGSIFYPLLSENKNSKLIIGKDYIGYMDELRISKAFIQTPILNKYQGISGILQSKIIDFGRSDSILQKISIDSEIPEDSAIFFYYNLSNNLENLFDKRNWISFSPSKLLLSENKGRYFSLKMELQANSNQQQTPLISKVLISYRKNTPPPAPKFFTASGGDSSITLSWKEMSEQDIEGYLIYYGSEAGVYFGSEAIEGDSPLVIKGEKNTSLTIHGLNNGQLYHFSIAAYDGAGIDYPGELSEETTSRPVYSGTN